MTVPASVLKVLEKRNIPYEIKNILPYSALALENECDTCLVRSVFLKDNDDRLQLLLPEKNLLDIEKVNRHLARSYTIISSEELENIERSQTKNNHSSSWQTWSQTSTLIDKNLLGYKTLWFKLGDLDKMIEISQESFLGLFDDNEQALISVPLSTIEKTNEQTNNNDDNVQPFTALRIKQRLENTLELPPLGDTAQRIIRLRADPEGDISDLTSIVELDPALAAQIVSWAASPYYSSPGRIKSIHDAVVRVLGFDMVLNLALGLALGRKTHLKRMNKPEAKAYWREAICLATVMEGLVSVIDKDKKISFGMSYMTGLLSNFGHLILSEVFPPYFRRISECYQVNPHIDKSLIDTYVIGISHRQLAVWLLENWNMSEEVVVAIREQDNPEFSGDYHHYAKLLFIARQLLMQRKVIKGQAQTISDEILAEVGLSLEAAENTINTVLDSTEELDVIAERMI